MKFKAKIQFHFNGALEVTAPDNHTARLLFASFFGSVVEEIQTWPTIDLNEVNVTARLIDIVPCNLGVIRGFYDFTVNGGLEVDNGDDEHTARVTLNELENSILDEVGNWPTTELSIIDLRASITGTA